MLNTKMKYLSFIIYSFLIISGSSSANQFEINIAGRTDTTISHVVSGGLWEHNKDWGRWRIIVRNLGWEHTRSYVYVQWLKIDEGKKEIIELKTIPISEFNEGNWRNVEHVDYSDNSFVINYMNRAEEVSRKAFLVPDAPGIYEISF